VSTLAVSLWSILLVTPLPALASRDLPVSRVTVLGDGQVDEAAVTEVLGLRIGDPLDRRQLRETIQVFYARTDVEWLRVEAHEQDNGLDVTVRVRMRATLSRLEVRTGNPILKNRVQKWLELQPGARISAAIVEAAQRRVVRRLQDRGYADPRIEAFIDYRRSSNTVVLTVLVSAGEPQVIRGVEVVGPLDPEIVDQVKPEYKPDARLTARLVERIRRQTEAQLRHLGYWDAQVIGVERRLDGHQVTLEIAVDSGPHYGLQIITDEEHEKLVANAVPDPAEEDLHPAQTQALGERIRERLQNEGYLLADVVVELATTGTQPTLQVTADPGAVRRIAEVSFPGARGLSEDVLRNAVSVRPGAVRGLFGRSITGASLDKDRLILEETYRSYGFVDVAVAAPVIEPRGDDEVTVSFPVSEGERWYLTDVRIEGLPVEAAALLEQRPLDLAEATPWNPRRVDAARRRLELILHDSGYPDGRVDAEVDTSKQNEARVVLRAEPGSFVRIGRVVIAGLTKTRESVVQRSIRRAGIEPGAPYSRRRLLEAQQRLYELGLFRRAELHPLPGQERRAERGLVVACEEGRQRSYLVGVGWNETDRARITLGWSHLNLFGGAHAVSAETRFSSREQRYQIGLREPQVPGLDVPGYMVIYRTFEEFRERGYDQLRRGLWIDVGDRLKRPFRTWLRYEYKIVQPDAPDDILSDLEREDQEARIASITPTLEWDYRNDLLVPTAGTLTSVSLEYAFPLFQADAEFLKLQSRFTVYRELLRGVGAAGIRIGAIKPLGSDTGVPANLQVPLDTRFFAGGSSSHRAFKTDFLGIPGHTLDEEGNPVGGNALILLNFEYQRPVSRLFSAVLFLDVGNVWASPSQVRLDDLRWGAGVGLRVETPAGPLRAEYGFKLDREPDESTGRFFLSFGVPF
jgi:outer membrane protein assembly complex protein YaeT